MKELSIKEKAKRYDEALDNAKAVYEIIRKDLKPVIEQIFPELKESEDEKLRKEMLRIAKESEDSFYMILTPNKRETLIAWLEKQGEQKSVDKVEPKFKVGKWYLCTKDFFGKGVSFDKNTAYYCAQEGCLQDEYGCHIAIVGDLYDNFKMWTIEDAKEGDVLCTYECGKPKIVFILKGTPKKPYVLSYYCYYNIMYPYFKTDSEKGCLAPNEEDIKPATTAQYNLLNQKMKEQGYKWDKNKKELIKL